MEKELTTRQFAPIKRVAQNVSPLVLKRNKLIQKIEELNNTIVELNEEIDGYEVGIKRLTGGLSSTDLIVRTVKSVERLDEEGNTIISTTTQWEPSSLVTYDKERNIYIIRIPDQEEGVVEPVENTDDSVEKDVDNAEDDTIYKL